MTKRHVTTLMGQLNKIDPIELKFDYGEKPKGIAMQKQIAAALTFWEFYKSLVYKVDGIANLPNDMDDLRHDLLERVASEDSLRGFIACWLRLPVTIVETLKWSVNLDIQSRESFLRRLLRSQIESVRGAYVEFFEYECVPSCMSDGSFRTWTHRNVSYESLAAEPLVSDKRTESKSAWNKEYAYMNFGHALYPEGAADDTSESGVFRKFLSVKNHVNDFAVNQHDGLYWFLYRTLRSNYVWNRNAEVKLSPRICPGFWVTIMSWFFITLFSPILALTVLFPLLTGSTDFTFGTLLGSVVGAVSPILLLLYSIFYFFRDSKTIIWMTNALDRHFDRYFQVWVVSLKALVFVCISMFALLSTVELGINPDSPTLYLFIPLLWLVAYWRKTVKVRDVLFDLGERESLGIVCLAGASVVLLVAPFTMAIFRFIGEFAIVFMQLLASSPLQILLVIVAVGIAIVMYLRTQHLLGYQTARSAVSTDRIARDYKILIALFCVSVCFYAGVFLWFLSVLVMKSSATQISYSVGMLVLVFAVTWFVLRDAFAIRKIDPSMVFKRNAYINTLRKHGLDRSWFMMALMDNNWIINHENPVETARKVKVFVTSFAEPLSGYYDQKLSDRLLRDSIYIIDARAVKQFSAYTFDARYDAYNELGRNGYIEFALRAMEGYSPEKALQKAKKHEAYRAGKQSFLQKTFPVRFFVGCVNVIEFACSAVAKVLRDLFGMWQIFHRYCPAVADTKQI